ncbi:hypothetical protein FWG95_04320 [Candidatus Saccharibacteria bacterium]|nr:hypothetical protein [Candidatus Saccharibacteria bacterium]
MSIDARNRNIVSVHTSIDTTDANRHKFVDDGLFVQDIAEKGLQLVLSGKRTFTEGGLVHRPFFGRDGVLSFQEEVISPDDIQAMHVRLVPSINVDGSETIPKLNSNNVKKLAGSKYELYRRVLEGYQVPTQLISTDTDLATMEEMIAVVSGQDVVLKSNSGAGGKSTKIMPKEEALQWLISQIDSDTGLRPQILQPRIRFGRLPEEIEAVDEAYRGLVERAKREDLLSELRMFIVKRGNAHTLAPVLRIVPNIGDKMGNDVYVDADLPDDLYVALAETTEDIINRVAQETGEEYILGAVDFYFDPERMPHVMEANLRSPELPVTRQNPLSGRKMHKAVASVLSDIVNERGRS